MGESAGEKAAETDLCGRVTGGPCRGRAGGVQTHTCKRSCTRTCKVGRGICGGDLRDSDRQAERGDGTAAETGRDRSGLDVRPTEVALELTLLKYTTGTKGHNIKCIKLVTMVCSGKTVLFIFKSPPTV